MYETGNICINICLYKNEKSRNVFIVSKKEGGGKSYFPNLDHIFAGFIPIRKHQ